jgi:aryl-alcohol dehydrogenase-like predicted oxidoreductase
MPRFSAENYPRNLELLRSLGRIAGEVGCSMAQLALAWLLARGDHVIPIPGTTSVAHLIDNLAAADVAVSAEVIEQLDNSINHRTVAGARYAEDALAEIDTEDFA